MHQRLGLITLKLAWVVNVPLEITILQRIPRDTVELCKVAEKAGRLQVGVTVGENEGMFRAARAAARKP